MEKKWEGKRSVAGEEGVPLFGARGEKNGGVGFGERANVNSERRGQKKHGKVLWQSYLG